MKFEYKRMDILNDFELWNKLREGNPKALDIIFDKYIRVLYNYGYRITKNNGLVEDSIQNLFIRIWEKRKNLGETNNIKFYLLRSLNRIITRELSAEKRKNQDLIPEDYDFEIVFSHEFYLIDNQITQERKEKLSLALDLLSKKQKEVIYHKFFNHLSYHEISEMMNISINSVYNLVSKAMQTLATYMKSNKTIWSVILGFLFF